MKSRGQGEEKIAGNVFMFWEYLAESKGNLFLTYRNYKNTGLGQICSVLACLYGEGIVEEEVCSKIKVLAYQIILAQKIFTSQSEEHD